MSDDNNTLYCGDNLEVMRTLPDEFVDLIYLDPPFFSNRQYNVIWGDEAEKRSFEDRWDGGIETYISWMQDRLYEMRRILKNTGSIYLHCDWHASHRLRVLMDEIFGERNFRNEIIWSYRKWSKSTKQFLRNHDNIYFYSITEDNNFNIQFVPYSKGTFRRWKGKKQKSVFDESGKRIHQYSGEEESPGAPMPDVWSISIINPAANERWGYPTQKPEKLLERIIKASSNPGDLVMDPFCGCGTTIAVAENLERNWIGIEISYTACELMKQRLIHDCHASSDSFKIIGMPTTIDDAKKLQHFDFQNWILRKSHAFANVRKTGDKGIDGFSFMHKYPIQVKQSEHVGRNVVDNFKAALDRVGQKTGFIVAFSFGSGAKGETARLNRDEGYYIELVTVKQILEGHTLTKDERGKQVLSDLPFKDNK
jgi:DNA modification methylase